MGRLRSSDSKTVRAGTRSVERVDGRRVQLEIRMRPSSERTPLRSDVRRGCANRKPAVRQCVLDAELDRERVARLGPERVLHHDAVAAAGADSPRGPANEPVDRIPLFGLGERELMTLAVELVAAVLDAVRPGHQHLASSRGALLVRAVAVQHFPVADRERAEASADLDDHCSLVAEGDLDLLSGRRAHALEPMRSSRWSPTRSAFAMAVRAGLTAPILGKKLVSTT